MSVRAATIRLLVFTVAGALAAASCGGSGATIAPSSPVFEASDYPMYKGGLGRTGEADGSGPSGPGVVAWSVETTGRIESGPVIVYRIAIPFPSPLSECTITSLPRTS